MNRKADLLGVPTLLLGAVLSLAVTCSSVAASEPCGTGSYPFPYTDVASVGDAFCPGIMEAYVTGVSKGTTPTTFSPNNTVTRVQMTTFLQRSLDQGLDAHKPAGGAQSMVDPAEHQCDADDLGRRPTRLLRRGRRGHLGFHAIRCDPSAGQYRQGARHLDGG